MARASKRTWGLLFHDLEYVSPERLLLARLQAGLVVHAKLDGVHLGHTAEKLCQGRQGVGGKVLLRNTPDQARRGLGGDLLRSRNAAALNAAAIDVVPDSDGEVQTAGVGHVDQPIQRLQIALLFDAGDADQPHVRELLDVEEIRIAGRQKTAVLIAKDHDHRVEPVSGQQIQVASPVGLVVEAALPVGSIHRVHGQGPLRHRRLFVHVANLGEGIVGVRAPSDAVRDIEQAVHQAAIIRAGNDADRLALPLRAADRQRFGTLRSRVVGSLE